RSLRAARMMLEESIYNLSTKLQQPRPKQLSILKILECSLLETAAIAAATVTGMTATFQNAFGCTRERCRAAASPYPDRSVQKRLLPAPSRAPSTSGRPAPDCAGR